MGDRGRVTGDKSQSVTSSDRFQAATEDVRGNQSASEENPWTQSLPDYLATFQADPYLRDRISTRPLALSYKSAGERIDRSARTIRRMVNRGELVGLKGQALVSYASLVAWVEDRTNKPTSVANSEDRS